MLFETFLCAVSLFSLCLRPGFSELKVVCFRWGLGVFAIDIVVQGWGSLIGSGQMATCYSMLDV